REGDPLVRDVRETEDPSFSVHRGALEREDARVEVQNALRAVRVERRLDGAPLEHRDEARGDTRGKRVRVRERVEERLLGHGAPADRALHAVALYGLEVVARAEQARQVDGGDAAEREADRARGDEALDLEVERVDRAVAVQRVPPRGVELVRALRPV